MLLSCSTILSFLPLLAVAAPSELAGAVTIPLINRNNLVRRDGSVDVAGLTRHVDFHSRGIKSGQIPLTDGGFYWYGSVSVGTPPKDFTMFVDTGTCDLVIPGVGASGIGSRKTYDPASSSSEVDLHKTFTIGDDNSYELIGKQYTETISVAGLTANNQTFGVASQYLRTDAVTPDGFLGLGFKSISVLGADSLITTLSKQGKLLRELFAVKLATTGSELSIGALNRGLFRGDVTYTPVIKEGYWQVNLEGLGVNGKIAVSNLGPAIINTGAVTIVGDATSVAAIYAQIPGSQLRSPFYTVPCNFNTVLSLKFGGRTFDIKPSTFTIGSYQGSTTECIGGLVGAQTPAGTGWIVGDIFLNNVYTVFDLGPGLRDSRVGFATLQ